MRSLLKPKHKRNEEANFRILHEIRGALSHKYCRPEGNGLFFIHPQDVKRVLQRERVRDLLGHFSWYKEDHRSVIWEKMSLIICILVVTEWRDWPLFKNYFYGPGAGADFNWPKVEDANLPLPDNTDRFLPEPLWNDFLREQYIFTPIFIRENSHDRVYNAKFRLPIRKRYRLDEDGGGGAQGVVEKVELDGRFVEYEGGRTNPNAQLMAMKRIVAKRKQDFNAEIRALVHFNNCLLQHRNIMKSITSFVHGSDFVILSPWAQGKDLHQFLYNPDKIFPNFPELSRHFSPNNLLTEAYSLAQGLNFLHNQMTTDRGRRLKCAHLDLKPENILVCFPPDAAPESCPVGQWKVTDFGMAKVEESVIGREIVPEQQARDPAPGNVLRDLSVQPPKRGAGPFQPPEVQSKETVRVSTRRDVWSYGCILAMVLAFALGGPEEVGAQYSLRTRGSDDYFYRRGRPTRMEQRLSMPNQSRIEAEVKPRIQSWLMQDAPAMHGEPHAEWIRLCSSLILSLLTVDVVQRPEITLAITDLYNILRYTDTHARERMWEFGDASTQPEVVTAASAAGIPIPRVAIPRNSVDSETDFMGLPSTSPPSSAASPKIGGELSSGSLTTFFKPDESISFVRLQAPQNSYKASIAPYASTAALYSPTEVFMYNLKVLNDDAAVWASKPPKASLSLEQHDVAGFQVIPRSQHNIIEKVLVDRRFVGLLERQSASASSWWMRIFARDKGKYVLRRQISLLQKPDDVKLSAMGRFAIKYPSHIHLYVPGRKDPVEIPFEGNQILGFSFSEDGQYLCLWERDRETRRASKDGPSPGHQASYYWTVWDANERAVGDTIQHPVEPYTIDARAPETFLIPFHKYPRFIACDRQYNFYLISADADATEPSRRRAVHLGRSANVWTGLTLPDDDGYLLIRASQHGKQKAERFALTSFGGSPSWKPYACGFLHADIDLKHHGFAMRNYSVADSPAVPVLLTLTPDGRLTRKIL